MTPAPAKMTTSLAAFPVVFALMQSLMALLASATKAVVWAPQWELVVWVLAYVGRTEVWMKFSIRLRGFEEALGGWVGGGVAESKMAESKDGRE